MTDLLKLAAHFPVDDIEWRIGQCGKKRDGDIWAKALAYVTNRAIMQRLDDVLGPAGWRNEYQITPAGVMCGISVKVGDEWITKWDGAEPTDIESFKGGLSSAMKRCAVQWGIGRYLYDLPEGWAEVTDNGQFYGKTKDGARFKWNPPALPGWALPGHEGPRMSPRAAVQQAEAEKKDPPKKERTTKAKAEPEDREMKGKRLGDMSDEHLVRGLAWAREQGVEDLVEDIEKVLDNRRNAQGEGHGVDEDYEAAMSDRG